MRLRTRVPRAAAEHGARPGRLERELHRDAVGLDPSLLPRHGAVPVVPALVSKARREGRR